MELCGIGTTQQRRPVGAIPPTALENRVNITIDSTVGSRSKFFHDFPEAVFDGSAWNRYDTLTASGWGHSTDSAREPGPKVHNYRSDRWISLNKFFASFRRLFSMKFTEIGTTQQRRPVGASPPTALENRVKRSITIDPIVGSRSNCFPSFRRLFSMELRGIGMTQ